MDAYNHGTDDGYWQSFYDVFNTGGHGMYYQAVTNAPTKSIMICETGCSEVGGSKASWITDMFTQLNTTLPNIFHVTLFDANNSPPDYRVDSSTGALNAWKAAVQTW